MRACTIFNDFIYNRKCGFELASKAKYIKGVGMMVLITVMPLLLKKLDDSKVLAMSNYNVQEMKNAQSKNQEQTILLKMPY